MATEDQLVAAVNVLVSVVRNIHLKKALAEVHENPPLNFWRLMYGNLMDMVVIDWCKLFGSDHEERQKLHWKNVVDDAPAFRLDLARHLAVDDTAWLAYWKLMKKYRDEHAAHADFEKRFELPNYPTLDLALSSSYFYYGALSPLLHTMGRTRYPLDLVDYGERFYQQALTTGRTAIDATRNLIERVY